MSRRFPMGRFAALVAAVLAAIVLTREARAPRFRPLSPGMEFAILRGDAYCRYGSAQIAVLRMDPRHVRLRVHHFALEPGDGGPPRIGDWQRRTGALAVFNAGQYYPDLSYMGLLVSGGRAVSARLHPAYKAALVAHPVAGPYAARVLDLEREPLDARRPGFREVAQSFMLFDRAGRVRIRKSPQIAARTVVAEDRSGRLLVFTSEGRYTLADFAELLRGAPLELTHAMCMDGGEEAQLLVADGRFRYASFAAGSGDKAASRADAAVPLPAVVAVESR